MLYFLYDIGLLTVNQEEDQDLALETEEEVEDITRKKIFIYIHFLDDLVLITEEDTKVEDQDLVHLTEVEEMITDVMTVDQETS